MSGEHQLFRAQGTRLRLTSAGAILLPISFACTAAALVIGGPATLLAAAAISLLGVAMFTSWLHMRGLELEALDPVERLVSEGFALRVRAQSSARWLPACAVTLRAETGAGKFGVLPFLAPGERATVQVPHRFKTRGLLATIEVRAGSSFPSGLIRCERRFELPAHCLALPRPLAREEMPRLPAFQLHGSTEFATRLAGDDELWAPREWREGESLRRVHWKLSAKRARLIVSEFRSHEDGPLEVILVTHVARLRAGQRHSSFERAVSVATAVCEQALRDRREVNLRLLDSPHTPETLLRGRHGRRAALRALALVKPATGDPIASASKEARLAIANGRPMVCVVAGAQATGSVEIPRHAAVHWIDVDAKAPDRTRRRTRGSS